MCVLQQVVTLLGEEGEEERRDGEDDCNTVSFSMSQQNQRLMSIGLFNNIAQKTKKGKRRSSTERRLHIRSVTNGRCVKTRG
jgi:hypothetical protein